MTGIEIFAPARSIPDGVHPFLPWRDLQAVIGLLEAGFGADLDERDRRWLSDLALAQRGPWGFVSRMFAATDRGFKGFVWYAGGRLVGNASLMHSDDDVWVIANVTTHPEHRRRGVAAHLMNAAVDAARASGAGQIQLQVRNDNEAALRLYADMGFWRMSTAASLRLAASAPRPPQAEIGAALAPGLTVAPVRRSDRAAIRRLLGRSGDFERGGPATLTVQSVERAGWIDTLDDWLEGKSRAAWFTAARGEPRGLVAVQAMRDRGPHRIDFAVEPRWAGQVEAELVAVALAWLGRHPRFEIEAEVETRKTSIIASLQQAGFKLVRVLDRLALDLE